MRTRNNHATGMAYDNLVATVALKNDEVRSGNENIGRRPGGTLTVAQGWDEVSLLCIMRLLID